MRYWFPILDVHLFPLLQLWNNRILFIIRLVKSEPQEASAMRAYFRSRCWQTYWKIDVLFQQLCSFWMSDFSDTGEDHVKSTRTHYTAKLKTLVSFPIQIRLFWHHARHRRDTCWTCGGRKGFDAQDEMEVNQGGEQLFWNSGVASFYFQWAVTCKRSFGTLESLHQGAMLGVSCTLGFFVVSSSLLLPEDWALSTREGQEGRGRIWLQ